MQICHSHVDTFRKSVGSKRNRLISKRQLSQVGPQGPTQSVRVADCCIYSKCTGFTVCLTYTAIPLTMYINQWSIKVQLPYLWYIVVLLPQKRFFEQFWRSLSSPLTVPNNRRTRVESMSWKGSSAGAIFPPKIASLAPLSNFVAKRSKDSLFFSYLPIENPTERPGASFFWLDVVNQMVK